MKQLISNVGTTAGFLLMMILVAGCGKQDSNPVAEKEIGGTWSPPASMYYKIDGGTNTPSLDAVQCSMNGGSVSIVKGFDNLSIMPGQLRIYFSEAFPSKTGYRNIMDEIPEGGWKKYLISPISLNVAPDSVNVELDMYYNGEYYYLKGEGGHLYVSKSGGKLRYTTDGAITMKGPKYVAPGFSGLYSRSLEFSGECGAQF